MISTRKDKFVDVTIILFLSVFSLMVFYPFYYVVINSLNADVAKLPALIFPRQLTLQFYAAIFSTNRLVNALVISVLRTVIGTVFSVMFLIGGAFALRKRKLIFRNFYLILFTITMFFDSGLIPYFLNLKALGLIDTFWVYIFPNAFNFFSIIILMSSFNELSDFLEESAYIDGASPFTILMKIYFPLCIPVIATISLFRAVNMWNAWFDTLYFTTNPKLMTLSGLLLQIISKNDAAKELANAGQQYLKTLNAITGIKFATIIVAVTPILMVYPFIQRYFIKGIRLGGIKE